MHANLTEKKSQILKNQEAFTSWLRPNLKTETLQDAHKGKCSSGFARSNISSLLNFSQNLKEEKIYNFWKLTDRKFWSNSPAVADRVFKLLSIENFSSNFHCIFHFIATKLGRKNLLESYWTEVESL